ncbi:hypothetical protein JX265_000479 [Neoarthrinium moseri]|uniref:Uncharacterized protein n=1 Tax=Neoarthrinium moseri TaxID=1658444 RepID=A0A9Q0ASA0_9PEZI|nr:hypothetical protein JX265_000479 [Neoarthrinium moseri]
MAAGPLIAHNRKALEDKREWGATSPQITYGKIFQHWRRGKNHPSFPGKEHNLVVSTGNYPGDQTFAYGWGKHPPGHPGNTIGLPENNQPTYSGSSHSGYGYKYCKMSSRSISNMGYAEVPSMRAYEPIPMPKMVELFERRFELWKRTWSKERGSIARVRCNVVEFGALRSMGTKILPLIVYKLCRDSGNFTAVFLYNALEENRKYLIDPSDVLNFLVLQRQSNLIVDINKGRKWETYHVTPCGIKMSKALFNENYTPCVTPSIRVV